MVWLISLGFSQVCGYTFARVRRVRRELTRASNLKFTEEYKADVQLPGRESFRSLQCQPILWLWLILLSLFIPSGLPASAQTATNFAIGTTVQQPNVKHFGINMGDENFYDSGQMLRNLIFRNPGFEAETLQSVIKCVAATATTCTDANVWNVWPANYLAGASFEVINGAALEETGTITSNTASAYAAGNTSNPTYGMTLSFAAPSIPLAAGDYLIVRMQIPGNAQAGWWTNTSGGGTLSTDTTDIASDSPGKQALMMSASQSGQSASVNQAFDTTGGLSFIQLKGTFTLDFKAKGMGGNNQLSVSVMRLATAYGNENFINQNVTLTNQWQDYSYSFNAAEDGSYVGPVEVVFSVAGASAYLDDVSLTAPAAANNPTAYRNEVVSTLQALHPGVLRYMNSYGEIGDTIANSLAVPFARQRAAHDTQSTEQDTIPMGLHDFLVLCQTVGAEPWFTVPMGITPADMQNLIQYLGGAASTPYGAIRASLGQSAPWTSVFPVIHLELGNELWNSAMTGEAILDPVVYGNRTATIFAAARASASYTPGSFDLIMGSQAVNPGWTQQVMSNSSGYDSVDVAPYLFYSLSDYSSNEAIFGPMFAQPEQADEPSSPSGNYMAQQVTAAAGGSTPAKLAIYEVNLSTISGTAPQSVVTQAVAGVGAGIAVADHMLLMLRDLGITTQNMFALPNYYNGFNCTASPCVGGETTPLWGSVIDMGGPTNVQRPTYLAEQLANSAILPTMLATTVTGANPTWNQVLSANDTTSPIQLANAHYLQSFAFTDGTHHERGGDGTSAAADRCLSLFSGANAVPPADVVVSQLTSTNITDNNENSHPIHPWCSPTPDQRQQLQSRHAILAAAVLDDGVLMARLHAPVQHNGPHGQPNLRHHRAKHRLNGDGRLAGNHHDTHRHGDLHERRNDRRDSIVECQWRGVDEQHVSPCRSGTP